MRYALFYRTGVQDCLNSIDLGDFDIGKIAGAVNPDTAAFYAVTEVLDAGDSSQIRDLAIEDRTNPAEAIRAWRDGWRATAVGILVREAKAQRP